MPETASPSFFSSLYSRLSVVLAGLCLIVPLAWGQAAPAFSAPLFACYDLTAYQLEVQFNSETERIAGTNTFQLEMMRPSRELQFDLDAPLEVHRVKWEGRPLQFAQGAGIVTVQFPTTIPAGRTGDLSITFGGKIKEIRGRLGPWQDDGGGLPMIVLNESTVSGKNWWPTKQSMPDPVDSLHLAVIADLGEDVNTAGEFLRREYLPGQFVKWHFAFGGPLLPQNLDLYVGQLIISTETYQNDNGSFQLRYLKPYGSQDDGPAQLAQVVEQIRCLEAFWGPFPFIGGGFDWVATGSTPTASLTQQLTGAWWGGAIQPYQPEDEWVIQSLQEYAEALVIECQQGSDASLAFLRQEASEGALMLHTLRRLTDNEETWFSTCRELAQTYQQQALSTGELTDFLDRNLALAVSNWVNHMHNEPGSPTLEYYVEKKRKKRTLYYRWATEDPAFDMPIDVYLSNDKIRLFPTMDWQTFPLKKVKEKQLAFDPDSGWVQYQSTTP